MWTFETLHEIIQEVIKSRLLENMNDTHIYRMGSEVFSR